MVPQYCTCTPADLLENVAAQVVAYQIGIPDGAKEQALHAIGACFSGVFGQVPAIFALYVTEQSLQVT